VYTPSAYRRLWAPSRNMVHTKAFENTALFATFLLACHIVEFRSRMNARPNSRTKPLRTCLRHGRCPKQCPGCDVYIHNILVRVLMCFADAKPRSGGRDGCSQGCPPCTPTMHKNLNDRARAWPPTAKKYKNRLFAFYFDRARRASLQRVQEFESNVDLNLVG
jgi:hypothetical protein